ncbi:uncharacterized protein LOC111789093 [Cucurbita pepo subsp. pepo]|uniref:uncharacterized protein LOC111789093 n=1 Tax=Cucurbita pepo subsp. pepo TaxID=3664 RepID=UPI000C9D5DCD|nr:uncharacterized protein LOC111789093 [Cucurbita pepo subsp. pepo]
MSSCHRPEKRIPGLLESRNRLFAAIVSAPFKCSILHHCHSAPNPSSTHATTAFRQKPPPTMVRCLFTCLGKGSDNGGAPIPNDKASSATADVTAEENRRGGAVLVELFSSQGCATSPEAEVLLSRLGRGDFELEVPVVVLAYHVDYWDYNGWKDPFGHSQWTVRQKAYVEGLGLDTMFTPQVVVQGRAQAVANDQDSLVGMIKSAPKFAAPTFQATFLRPTTDSLEVTLTGALRTKVDSDGADVMVALYESGLVTDISGGDNKGRVLANDFVVRKLEKLCSVKSASAKKTVSGTVAFCLWEGFNGTKCGVAVFVQNNLHHIFGCQSFQLPEDI